MGVGSEWFLGSLRLEFLSSLSKPGFAAMKGQPRGLIYMGLEWGRIDVTRIRREKG